MFEKTAPPALVKRE